MAEIIRDLITDIQSRYSKGVRSNSSRLSNRMVYHKMKAIRSTLIAQKANKKEVFSESFYQLLSGVEMIPTKSSMLSTLSIGESIRKSKTSLPQFIYNQDVPQISTVSNIEASKLYNRTTWQTIKNSSGRKFTGNEPTYFPLDNDIYINDPLTPKVIAIKAIFEDPIEAQIYPVYNDPNCNTYSCNSYLDYEFAVDKDMGNVIVQLATEELLRIYDTRREDRIQDGVDNTK